MKKIVSILVFASIIISGLFSAVYKDGKYTVNSEGLEIQAGYGEFAEISITPIAAQSEAYLAGMPFNIMEPYVQYQAENDGRLIAKWDVLANTPFSITITECPHLKHETSDTALPYHLTFEYDVSYYDGTENKSVSGEWVFTSGQNNQKKNVKDVMEEEPVAGSYFIGSVAGDVFFQFDQVMPDGVTLVSDAIDDAPGCNYFATVKICIEADEGAQ